MTARRFPQRAVVLGGGGAVGTMISGVLAAAGVRVTIVDRVAGQTPLPPLGRFVHDDATAPSLSARDAVAEADLVVLALPEPAAVAALPVLVSLLDARATLVDTLSVKHRILAAYREHPRLAQVVGVNPMFAPSLGIVGRPVLRATVRAGEGVSAFAELLVRAGAVDVPVDPEQHDAFTAVVQCLPHAAVLAYGLALSRCEVDAGLMEAAQPPPSAVMHALAARMLGGAPEVYLDIQAANPHAAAVRSALASALRELCAAVERPSCGTTGPSAFTDALDGASSALAGSLDVGQERCLHLFQQLHPNRHATSRPRTAVAGPVAGGESHEQH